MGGGFQQQQQRQGGRRSAVRAARATTSSIKNHQCQQNPPCPKNHTQGINDKLPPAVQPLNQVGICFATYALLIHDFTPPPEYQASPFHTKVRPRGPGVGARDTEGVEPKPGTRLKQLIDWLAGGQYPPMIVFGTRGCGGVDYVWVCLGMEKRGMVRAH